MGCAICGRTRLAGGCWARSRTSRGAGGCRAGAERAARWGERRDEGLLRECEWVGAEVERVLGRRRGIRIGEEPDRDGQYFHYLAMWLFALDRLGAIDARYRAKAIALVRDIHHAFVVPGTGVIWKMREDLSAPYPGCGLGALDAFHGLVVYRQLDPAGL